METKSKAIKDTLYINPNNSNNLNNTTNTITTKRDILNYSQANIEILSNNTVEDSISKMFFYFSMIYEIAIEYVPTSKLEEIEIINMKFKKIAEKLHKENNKQILNSFNFNSTNNNSNNNKYNNSNVNSNTNILSSSFNNNNVNNNVNNNKALNNLSSLTQIAPTIFDNSLFSNIKHDKSFANNKNINLFTNESNNNDVSYDSGNNRLINTHVSNHYGNSSNLNFNSNLINENHDMTNTSIISKVVLVNSNKEDKKYLKIKQVIELKDSKDNIKEITKDNTKLKFNYIAMSALDLNDNYIIIGLENGEIKVISKNNKNLESKNNHSSGNINFSICQILNNHTYPIYSLCKLDNSSFVSGEWSKQGKLVFWKTNTNNNNSNSNDSSHNVFSEFKSKNFNDGVSCIIKIMSGVIAIGFVSGVILLYNIFADKVLNKISLHSKEIRAMSLNDNLLISGGRDKNIYLFDILAKKKNDFQFNLEHKSWINCLTSFNYIDNSSDGGNKKSKVINTLSNMFVISGGGDTNDPYVKIWKYGYNKSIRTLLLHSDIIIHLDYNKELDYLITGCYDGSIKKIRIDFNELIRRFNNKSTINNNNNIEENKNNSVSGVYHILEEKIIGSSIDKLIIINNNKNNIHSVISNVNVDNNETESEYDWKNQSVEEGDIKNKLDDKLNNNNNMELVGNSNNKNKELLKNMSLNESFVVMKWKNTSLSIY